MSKLSPEKVFLGITPTLWWNDDFIDIDIGIPFEQCVSEMALAGYIGCSIGHKYPKDPVKLKQELDSRGLRVSEPWVSTYFTINDMKEKTLNKVKQQLDFLDAMGSDGDLVVAELGRAVHPLPDVALYPNAPTFSDKEWKALVDGLHEAGRLAKARNRKLCYHPHMGTGVMVPEAVDRLMKSTDHTLVYLLLDTAHLYGGGYDPLKATEKWSHRVGHIHLKDIRKEVLDRMRQEKLSFKEGIKAGIFTVPLDGSIQTFPQIIDELAKANFTGWLVIEAEQDPATAHPLTYAKKAREALKTLLGW